MKPRIIISGLLLLIIALLPELVRADSPIKVLDQNITAKYREEIVFKVKAQSTAPITEAQLFYRVAGNVATARGDAKFDSANEIEATFSIDQKKDYLPTGTELEYWWKLKDNAGNEFKTDIQDYTYIDERYSWQELKNERLSLRWYEGGESFGQKLFDKANEAMDRLENDAGIKVERAVKIFIYANQNDLLGAIAVGSQEWTGGEAFTDQGVVVIGIEESNLAWGLRATAHELTHLVIHQATKNPYGDMPRWLDEGLAVYNEGEAEPDSIAAVEEAVRDNKLMTVQTISSSFPADTMEARLAYAQSRSLVEFIIKHYGPDALKNLLSIFAEGSTYDDALKQALKVDTRGLDNAWRESIGAPPLPGSEAKASSQPAATPAVAASSSASAEKVKEPAGVLAPCSGGLLPGLLGIGMLGLAGVKKAHR
jgi:hypothetical protein